VKLFLREPSALLRRWYCTGSCVGE
jgi:hypothetical protein